MHRRSFLARLTLGTLAAPLVAGAQQPGKIARIGTLSIAAAPSAEELARSSFRSALRNLGWVAGQNLVIEARYAAGQLDRLPALAIELVRLEVDVIVTLQDQETLAAKQATTSIPIVMVLGINPVGAGLVASYARPGRNVTGTVVPQVTDGKYLELLKEAVPKLKRVAKLWDPTYSRSPESLSRNREWSEAEARKLGLTLASIEVQGAADVESALARIAKERPGALWVVTVGPLLSRMQQVIDFATKHALPTIFPARSFVEAGGLMSYGFDREHLVKRAAWYVDRILKGAQPADLPVEQPGTFELVINLKTAKALGLTIPQTLLLRADRIIEQ